MTRRTKPQRALFALAMALVLCLSSFGAVFAAGDPVIGGTATDPAEVALTKILEVPENTALPTTAEFEFTFTKVSKGGSSSSTALAGMPDIPTITLDVLGEISAQTAASSSVLDLSGGATPSDHVQKLIVQTANIFASFDETTFDSEGIYVWSVTETDADYGSPASNVTTSDSVAEYQITAWVKEDSSNAGEYYIEAIAATIITEDNVDQTAGEKVDPGIITNITETSYSTMVFTNTYYATSEVDITDPTLGGPLSVANLTTGTGPDTSLYFPYTISVANPALSAALPSATALPTEYVVYLVDTSSTDVVITDTNLGLTVSSSTDTDSGELYYTIPSDGTATSVYLKDNQKLVFKSIPQGAVWEVTDILGATPFDVYTASAVVIEDGSNVSTSFPSTTAGASLTIDDLVIGALTNSATFSNDGDSTTPTGINLNTLPYYGLILLALLALVAYVVTRSRRRQDVCN